MLKVRNTLVALKLIEKADQKHGAIFVNSNAECYCEAEVISVGPGNIQAEGGRSETADLYPGQRVLVQHKKKFNNGSGLVKYVDEGLPVRFEDETYLLFEQTSVLAVLSEPSAYAAANPQSLFAKPLNAAYTMGPKAILPSDNH